jgi:Flp pilus assembly protein TadG
MPVPRGDRGAAAVEFALVAPVLFLLLFGTIQYGFLFFQMQAASSTARNVARWAAVGIPSCPAYAAAIGSDADSNGVPALGRQVTTTYTNLPGNPNLLAPDLVSVTVQFSPTAYVPFVPFPDTLSRTAVARVEDTTRPSQLDCGVVTP